MNKKIYLTEDYKQNFINYYNDDFCERFNCKKIDTKKLSKLFDYALSKGTWRDFAGYSKVFGKESGCGTSAIFLVSGETITGYDNIIKFEENYYNTDKENFMKDIMHELACEVERFNRMLGTEYDKLVNRTIKNILLKEKI